MLSYGKATKTWIPLKHGHETFLLGIGWLPTWFGRRSTCCHWSDSHGLNCVFDIQRTKLSACQGMRFSFLWRCGYTLEPRNLSLGLLIVATDDASKSSIGSTSGLGKFSWYMTNDDANSYTCPTFHHPRIYGGVKLYATPYIINMSKLGKGAYTWLVST